MTDRDFNYIRRLLKDRCAIALEPDKQYLVESRLTPVVHELKMLSISDLVSATRADSGHSYRTKIVEAMVTTETSFFRDHKPFETLRATVLPSLIEKRRSECTLNIWCAASSTGQEAYSLAMLIREHFPQLARWTVNLLASDISSEVLARAIDGTYNQTEANRGLPAAMLVKYFERNGVCWQLTPTIRNMVQFQEINLAKAWPCLPRMDLILLRNVMIYFDVETKKSILTRMARLMRPDGYLLLGGAETTINLVDCFQRIEHLKSGFYQPVV